MATQLKNILRFVNVAPGAAVALSHGLAWSPPGGGELPQIPDVLIPSGPGFQISANATTVTVVNETAVVRSVDVLAELWHTFERAFGDVAIEELVPRPFVVDLGADIINLASAVLGFGEAEFPAAEAIYVVPPWYEDDGAAGPGTVAIDMVAPRAGTLRNLFVRHNAAGNGGTITYTVVVNGVPTALQVAALSSNAIGQASDLVDSVAVAQGDRIGLTAEVVQIGEEGGGIVQAVATMQFGA